MKVPTIQCVYVKKGCVPPQENKYSTEEDRGLTVVPQKTTAFEN